MRLRIGILGAGNMAAALGAKWVTAGHDVLIGARSAERADSLARRIGARAGSLSDSAAYGDAVLTSVGHAATAEVIGPLAHHLAGKAVLDCSNPIAQGPGGPMLVTAAGTSAAQAVAAAAPDAHVVKAFHLGTADVWAGPLANGLAVPLCGDDELALALAGDLVTDIGAIPLQVGGLDRAGYLEAMAAIVIGMRLAGQDPRTMLPLAEPVRG